MATIPATNVRFKSYRYTADNAAHFTVRVDKTWGDNADSGFAAYNASDPVFPSVKGAHPRYARFIDPQSGSSTKRPVGSTACTAWTTNAYVLAVDVRGLHDTVPYTKTGNFGERFPASQTVYSRPQPVEAA